MTLSQRIDLGIYRVVERRPGHEWYQTRITEFARQISQDQEGLDVPSSKLVHCLTRLHSEDLVDLQTYPPGSRTPYPFEGEGDQTFFDRDFQVQVTSKGHPYFEELEEKLNQEDESSNLQPLIFVSCGQYSEQERRLGLEITSLIENSTDYRAYFAEKQEDLEGLSRNIFGALNKCVGFVAVMHHRGDVQTPSGHHQRASVWIEQEIAITAFLRQVLDREIEVAVYFQEGIRREGVREQLILNPTPFSKDDEVLADLRAKIAAGKFRPRSSPDTVGLSAELDWHFSRNPPDPKEHRYELIVWIKNTGSDPIDDYWFDLEFPRAAIVDSVTIGGEDEHRGTETHRFFRGTGRKLMQKLYPEDRIKAISGLPYRMTDDLLDNSDVLHQTVRLTLNAPGKVPKRIEKPFKELQDF